MGHNSTETNPHTYSQLIHKEEARINNREKTDSSASGVGKAGRPPLKDRKSVV